MADDQELLAVLNRRFDELSETIEESRTENRQRFERLEGEIRHAHVRIESLDGAVRQAAESVTALDQRLSRRVDGLETKMDREFDDVRSLIRLSYRRLDRRVTALEDRNEQLDG